MLSARCRDPEIVGWNGVSRLPELEIDLCVVMRSSFVNIQHCNPRSIPLANACIGPDPRSLEMHERSHVVDALVNLQTQAELEVWLACSSASVFNTQEN